MSYTVLARRYRSTTFDEVVGQAHVAQTLKKAIVSGRVAHAYLFCGTRGVGKTSMARILAKALNCSGADGPTPEPCGACVSCLSIARGDDIDVIEIDAASNTGVEKIRDLIENAQYRPARSRLKIYIIDEVHMLSRQAFNALLKTMEEPPSHVKFILATTEPEKVLPTILSRCQRFDFRNIPTREIVGHLRDICTQEKIQAEEDALLMVAKVGAGSMRDALTLLDRLLSIGQDTLTTQTVEQLLGLPRSQLLFDLAQAIGSGDTRGVLMQADAMISAGLSPEMLIASLVDHLRNLLILSACGGASDLVEAPGLRTQELGEQAKKFDAVALSQDIVILEELRRMMRSTQASRALLDATLVRLALSEQFTAVGDLLEQVDGQPVSGAQKKKRELTPPAVPPLAPPSPGNAPSGAAPQASTSPTPPPSATDTMSEERTDSHLDAVEVDDDLPAVGRVWEGQTLGTRALLKPRTPPQPARAAPLPPPVSNVEPVDPSNLPGVWQALLAMLASDGPGLPALLASAQYIGERDDNAVIRFNRAQETFIRMLERNGKQQRIRDAFSQILKKPVNVQFEVSDDVAPPPPAVPPVAPPPARTASPASSEAPPASNPPGPTSVPLTPELIEELSRDPLVHAVLETLGGSIVKVTEH